MRTITSLLSLLFLASIYTTYLNAADPSAKKPARGSIIEDRAARKLLQAGELRFDAGEEDKAIEIWESVIERYPRSRIRFEARLKLGEFYLVRKNAYDKARVHFEAVAREENRDQDQSAEAVLKTGACFYEARHYGQCFKVMRRVIEEFPVSEQVTRRTTTSVWGILNRAIMAGPLPHWRRLELLLQRKIKVLKSLRQASDFL